MNGDRQQTRVQIVLRAAAVGVAYYAFAQIGMALSFKPDFVAALWPPNALMLWVLLRWRPGLWPYLLLPTIGAELAADLPAGIPPLKAFAFYLCDVVEVVLSYLLLRRFIGLPLRLDSFVKAAKFPLIAGFIAPMLSGLLWALFNCIIEQDARFWVTWRTFYLGDALAQLAVAPALIMWLSDFPEGIPKYFKRHMAEYLSLFALLVWVTWFIFFFDVPLIGRVSYHLHSPVRASAASPVGRHPIRNEGNHPRYPPGDDHFHMGNVPWERSLQQSIGQSQRTRPSAVPHGVHRSDAAAGGVDGGAENRCRADQQASRSSV